MTFDGNRSEVVVCPRGEYLSKQTWDGIPLAITENTPDGRRIIISAFHLAIIKLHLTKKNNTQLNYADTYALVT